MPIPSGVDGYPMGTRRPLPEEDPMPTRLDKAAQALAQVDARSAIARDEQLYVTPGAEGLLLYAIAQTLLAQAERPVLPRRLPYIGPDRLDAVTRDLAAERYDEPRITP
jgi:hypothetical protein